jgi:hypothetical protein
MQSSFGFMELAMKKLISAALAVLITTTMIPTQSFALIAVPPPPPPPPVTHGGSGGAGGAGGAGAAGGIIGVAALLSAYDLIRRTTCSGDFLHFGGPGFTEPMAVGNVMIPQCPAVLHTNKRNKH